MSSDAVTATASETEMYWCHECDMSVTLLSASYHQSSSSSSSPQPLLCPHCFTDFLEHMDFTTSTITTTSSHAPPPPLPSLPSLPPPPNPNPDPMDDNFLLDSPYLQRLIHHLSEQPYDGADFTTTTTIASPTSPHKSLPTSKSAIDSLPTLIITSSFLDLDPLLLCAICKDQFLIDIEAKQLPCKHLYHPDCILPWLSNHNSCPVCRFQLPAEDVCKSFKRMRMAMRFRELMTEEDSFGFQSTLRHIARRHRIRFPWRQVDPTSSLLSPTQMAGAEMEEAVSISPAEAGVVALAANGGVNGSDGDVGIAGPIL